MNRILSFGSLNIDYVYAVDHFVRAGETLASDARAVHAGGKGLNQSLAAARAGGNVFHAGNIGSDGVFLRELLEKSGVDTRYVFTGDSPSGHAIIQVDQNGQNAILLYPGANHTVTEDGIDRVLGAFGADDWLILQNEINNLPYLMKRAYARGMKIVLNPSPITPDLASFPLETVSLFVLNEIEGRALTGQSEPRATVTALRTRFPGAAVLLSLGTDGSLYDDGKTTVRCGIYRVRAVDTTAAGDTMTGYFVASLAEGIAPADALHLASRASALAVSRPGAAPSIPTRDELKSFFPAYAEPET